MDLNQKIAQMFITGYQGFDFEACPEFVSLLKRGLGGVIFFTQNIKDKEQFKSEIEEMKHLAPYPLFFSIDQEGGRVERTQNLYGGAKYLSAGFAREKGEEFLRKQTSEMLRELESFGINMNFAPVLDVNTEIKNPIIGERAYSGKTEEVINAAKTVLNEYKKHKIIPVGKHFPGHGAAKKDSHLTLPEIDVTLTDLKETHIRPFKEAIERGLEAVMVAHVHYPSIDQDNIPASLSKNAIQKLLREELGFNGVVISDDMVMGGVNGYSPFEACKRGIEAGINMFIYRNTDKQILDLISQIETAVKAGEIGEKLIDDSVKRINCLKSAILK